jgi:hypothetical protein
MSKINEETFTKILDYFENPEVHVKLSNFFSVSIDSDGAFRGLMNYDYSILSKLKRSEKFVIEVKDSGMINVVDKENQITIVLT